jgi:hypothetical protein
MTDILDNCYRKRKIWSVLIESRWKRPWTSLKRYILYDSTLPRQFVEPFWSNIFALIRK